MGQRLKLQTLLELVLGSRNVYFQPPENVKLVYPCIIYQRDSERRLFADDGPYFKKQRYSVTVIDRNPDSEILERVSELPMTSFNRHYTADNLNHDVFNIYF